MLRYTQKRNMLHGYILSRVFPVSYLNKQDRHECLEFLLFVIAKYNYTYYNIVGGDGSPDRQS